MDIYGSIAIVAILILRRCFAKLPKRITGLFWIVAGVRLLCPVNIDIAMVNKFYDLAAAQEQVPASVQEHYEALGTTASACIGCRSCESRCPFGVSIAARRTAAAGLFGC